MSERRPGFLLLIEKMRVRESIRADCPSPSMNLNPAMGYRAKTQRPKEEADADKQAFTHRGECETVRISLRLCATSAPPIACHCHSYCQYQRNVGHTDSGAGPTAQFCIFSRFTVTALKNGFVSASSWATGPQSKADISHDALGLTPFRAVVFVPLQQTNLCKTPPLVVPI